MASAAERMRLSRKRKKLGKVMVTVEVDPGEVDALIDRGYLQPKHRDDLEVVAAAVTACFSDALDDAVTAAVLVRCDTVTNSIQAAFA